MLSVGIGSRVILKRNTDVHLGLCNGALGSVVGFEADSNQEVNGIKVKFDKVEESVIISKITADFELQKNIYIPRTQFPLSLAWALTIHKAQGLSLDAVLLDIGSSIFEGGQAYVALSRARNLSSVFLIDFVPHSLYCRSECISEYNRLIAKYYPNESIIAQFNMLPGGYEQFQNKKAPKITVNLISNFEKEICKQYVHEKSIPQYHMKKQSKSKSSSILKPQFIAKNKATGKNIQNKVHIVNTNATPNISLNQENYALLLRNNGENSCFANSQIQFLMCLGDFFANQVFIITMLNLCLKIFILLYKLI